jgi:hypothetical protein
MMLNEGFCLLRCSQHHCMVACASRQVLRVQLQGWSHNTARVKCWARRCLYLHNCAVGMGPMPLNLTPGIDVESRSSSRGSSCRYLPGNGSSSRRCPFAMVVVTTVKRERLPVSLVRQYLTLRDGALCYIGVATRNVGSRDAASLTRDIGLTSMPIRHALVASLGQKVIMYSEADHQIRSVS